MLLVPSSGHVSKFLRCPCLRRPRPTSSASEATRRATTRKGRALDGPRLQGRRNHGLVRDESIYWGPLQDVND